MGAKVIFIEDQSGNQNLNKTAANLTMQKIHVNLRLVNTICRCTVCQTTFLTIPPGRSTVSHSTVDKASSLGHTLSRKFSVTKSLHAYKLTRVDAFLPHEGEIGGV